jgi:hypothetical protein
MLVGARTVLALFEPVTIAIHFKDVNVVETIEQGAGQAFRREHTGPLIEGQRPYW